MKGDKKKSLQEPKTSVRVKGYVWNLFKADCQL